MDRSVVLQNSLFEDPERFSLESLLGRCVSNMDSPTDDFGPSMDVSLDDCIAKCTLKQNRLSFTEYIKKNSNAGMEAKITDIFVMAHRKHRGSEFDIEKAQTVSLDLFQLPDVFEVLRAHSPWLDPSTKLWHRNKKKAYWIVGITIVTSGKIVSTRQYKEEDSIESTLPLAEVAAAVMAAQGVSPHLVPWSSLDLQAKVAKTTEVEAHGEMEVTSRCLFSVRYALLGRAKPRFNRMALKNVVAYEGPKSTGVDIQSAAQSGAMIIDLATGLDGVAAKSASEQNVIQGDAAQSNQTVRQSTTEHREGNQMPETEEEGLEARKSDEELDMCLYDNAEHMDVDLGKADRLVISHIIC